MTMEASGAENFWLGRSSSLPIALVIGALVFAIADRVTASDGVLEINQTCATQTGCFAGDAAGFPVRIDGSLAPATSFRLTSDLVVPTANTGAIELAFQPNPSAGVIDLDLAGFSRRGATVCSPTGLGTGISLSAGAMRGSTTVASGASGARVSTT